MGFVRTVESAAGGDGRTSYVKAGSSRARDAAAELFELAVDLEGPISGEHGLGLVKGGWLARQWSPAAVELHSGVKRLFDPHDILNPGKTLPAPQCA